MIDVRLECAHQSAVRIARKHGIRYSELRTSGRRHRFYSDARAVIAYVLREVHRCSWHEIARLIGCKDHTSAMAAYERCGRWREAVGLLAADESQRLRLYLSTAMEKIFSAEISREKKDESPSTV